MKKILLLSILAITIAGSCVTNASAQQVVPAQIVFHSTTGALKDTTNNTDTTIGTLNLVGNWDIVTFQYNVNKISGTVGSRVLLQASLDNVNFNTLDTLTNTNVATNTRFTMVGKSNYYYYRLYYITTGTQSSYITAYYVARKTFGQ